MNTNNNQNKAEVNPCSFVGEMAANMAAFASKTSNDPVDTATETESPNCEIKDIIGFTVARKSSYVQEDFEKLEDAFLRYTDLANVGMEPILLCAFLYKDYSGPGTFDLPDYGDVLLQDGSLEIVNQKTQMERFTVSALMKYQSIRVNLLKLIAEQRQGDNCGVETATPNCIRDGSETELPHICIDLGFTKLTAEVFNDEIDHGVFEKGIVIGLEDTHGEWQDIASVSVTSIGNTSTEPGNDQVKCKVWTDPTTDEYTNRFVIPQAD